MTRRIVIIGGGFAGASTAYHLAQRGFGDVVLLERERFAGMHASGRNAAMVRQLVPQPQTAALAREGCAFIRRWAARQSIPVYKETGSLLLYSNPLDAQLAGCVEDSRAAGVCVETLSRGAVVERVPCLDSAVFDAALWCPSDGIVDISALLSHYLSESERNGARVVTQAGVEGFEHRNGRLTGVRAHGHTFPCDIVVNAAGAWANEIALRAGARARDMRPYRRHLFVTQTLAGIDSQWPYVWNISQHLYFRPETPGLLLSPCDQCETDPGVPATDGRALDLLAEKLARFVPALSSVSIARAWAGLRTIASDDRFILGWDGAVRGLFWVAALGGHGVTCSASVGRLAASLMQEESAP